MRQYHELLKNILVNGDVQYDPRTQEQVLGLSGAQSIYDLKQGFPLVTTKKVASRLIFEELFWKLRGERNIKTLSDKNVHIWDGNAFQHYLKRNELTSNFPKHSAEWEQEFEKYKEKISKDSEFAKTEGDLGPVYGYQWRHWKKSNGEEVDQLEDLLKNIVERPGSRYHTLSAWNVGELSEMALGPCPLWHQFTVYGNKIDLHAFQRSCDVFLGVPFNIAQDSLLLHMIGAETDLKPRKFIHTYGNVHIYLGVPPRTEFWGNEKNVEEFKRKVKKVFSRDDYIKLKEWYLRNAPEEDEMNKRKDHIPFVLTQLSKSPRELPLIKIKDSPLFEAIKQSSQDIVCIENYLPHEWDAKAKMAV